MITIVAEHRLRAYLGGYQVASAYVLVYSHDIKCIVNCTRHNCREVGTPLGWMLRPPYRWMRFKIASAPSEPFRVIRFWMILVEFLQKAFRLNCGALILCEAGNHQAAAASAAFVTTTQYCEGRS